MDRTHSVMAYLHTSYVYCFMFLYALILPFVLIVISAYSMLAVLVWPFDRKGHLFDLIYRHWPPIVMWMLRVKIVTHGLEHLKPNTSYVFASNHVSYLDIPILSISLPGKLRIMYRHELTRIPFFGWALASSPFIRIYRDDPRAAVTSIKHAMQEITDGASVIVYPEGTRSADGKLGEFKRGAFVLATKTGTPVVPVAIKGAGDLLPRDSLRVLPGTVEVYIGEPLPSNTPGLESVVHERVQEMLEGKMQ